MHKICHVSCLAVSLANRGEVTCIVQVADGGLATTLLLSNIDEGELAVLINSANSNSSNRQRRTWHQLLTASPNSSNGSTPRAYLCHSIHKLPDLITPTRNV